MSRVVIVTAAVLFILAVNARGQDTLPPSLTEAASQVLNTYSTVTKIQTRVIPDGAGNAEICVGVQYQTTKLEVWTGSFSDGTLSVESVARVESNVLDFSFLDRGSTDCEVVLLTTSNTLSFDPFEFYTAALPFAPTKVAYSLKDYDNPSSARMLFFINGTGGFTVVNSDTLAVEYSYVTVLVSYNSISVANFGFEAFVAAMGTEGSIPPGQGQMMLGAPSWGTNGYTSTGARQPSYTSTRSGVYVLCYDNGAIILQQNYIYCGSSFLDGEVPLVNGTAAGGLFFQVQASPVQDNVILVTSGVSGASPKFKLLTVSTSLAVIDDWNGYPLTTSSPAVGSHSGDNIIAVAYTDTAGNVTLRIFRFNYAGPPIINSIPTPEPPVASPGPLQPSASPIVQPVSSPSSSTPSDTGTPTSPPTPPNDSVTPPNGDLSQGDRDLIIGLILGAAGLGVGVFLLVFFLKKKQKRKNKPDEVPMTGTGDEPTYGNIPGMIGNNKYSAVGNTVPANDDGLVPANIQPSEIDKRLHIPHKSLVFVREIGAGSYGKVFLGEWRGAKVAIKVNNTITDVDGFLAEAKLTLGIPPHPNLVQTFGISLDGPNPCIVQEYCGGGSLDIIFGVKNGLTNAKRLDYALKIGYGLLHLHSRSIVHRDLAARNILLTNDGSPKISDFGMSRIVQEEAAKGRTKTNVGPIRWMAPESLRDRSYSLKTDVWTYAIMLYEIVSGKEPHEDEDQFEIALKIRDQGYTPTIPDDCDPTLREVMEMCWKKSPADRPTMEEICDFLRSKTTL
jgi:hypothetical protein